MILAYQKLQYFINPAKLEYNIGLIDFNQHIILAVDKSAAKIFGFATLL